MVREPETIKCTCGYDTGISSGPLLLVIKHDVVCPNCNFIIINVHKYELSYRL